MQKNIVYFCKLCEKEMLSGASTPIMHFKCFNLLCFKCCFKVLKTNKKCPFCKGYLFLKDLHPQSYSVAPPKLIINCNSPLTQIYFLQVYNNYIQRNSERILLYCALHKKKAIYINIYEDKRLCEQCRFIPHLVNFESMYSVLYDIREDIEIQLRFAKDYEERLNRYFKDKIAFINSIIINQCRRFMVYDVIPYLETVVDSGDVTSIEIVSNSVFNSYHVINSKLYKDFIELRKKIKEKVITYQKDNKKLTECLTILSFESNIVKLPQELEISVNKIRSIKTLVDNFYERHPHIFILGSEFYIFIQRSILEVLCRYLNSKDVIMNALKLIKEVKPVTRPHSGWLSARINPFEIVK